MLDSVPSVAITELIDEVVYIKLFWVFKQLLKGLKFSPHH